MARPRKPVSRSYAKRNERARALGYRSYYDYRIHAHGKIPPDQPAPTGNTRARLRGHRSLSDLKQDLKPGTLVTVQSTDRDPRTGRLKRADVLTVDEKGRQRTYRLTGAQLTVARINSLADVVERKGAVFSPSPSLDLRRVAE